MAELVAHGTDAGNGTCLAVEFAAAGVGIDFHAVEGLRAVAVSIILSRGEVPLVWPDGGTGSAVGFALACIDDIDLVDLAVAVPVVVGEVDVVVDKFQGLDDHLGGIFVVALSVVSAIVGLGLGYSHRSDNIKREFELPLALSVEVVVHGAFEVAVGEVFLVGDALIEGVGVGFLKCDIAEVDQNDDALLLTGDGTHFAYAAWSESFGAAGVRLRAAGLCLGGHGGEADLREIGCAVLLLVGAAVLCEPVVAVFVANESCFHSGSVAERERTDNSWLSRNSADR